MKKFLKDNATLIALIVMMLIIGLIESTFLTPRNLSNLSRQIIIIGIIAVGMTMVILIEGIDLSVGSIVGLSAIVVTTLMQMGLNVWIAIIFTILIVGILIGSWNGFWIAKYKIPPFIITLGMMTIARGLALVISNGSSVPVTNDFFSLIGGSYIPNMPTAIIIIAVLVLGIVFTINSIKEKKKYGIEIKKGVLITNLTILIVGLLFALYIFVSYKGIPTPVAIYVVIIGIGVFVLRHTRFGRRLYAIGGNEEAARLSGINIFKTKMIVFCIATCLATLSGIILASRLNGASPNLGEMFELDAIAAVVIGGTSLSGGSGTITGSVIGACIIGVLNNGMSLLGVSEFYQKIFKGLIIIFAVWFDVSSKKKKG